MQMRYVLAMCLLTSLLLSEALPSPLLSEPPRHLIVHNRILAKINEKTISVLDVMKKMDLLFSEHYSHLAHSPTARYQFYASSWKEVLRQIVNTELMLADAKHLEVKVTEAEVREEMLSRFGPNVMATLDRLALTYDEAKQMVHSDLIVQRMSWFKVNSRAMQSVNPRDIRAAYQALCEQNPPLEKWRYQVVTIRAEQSDKGEQIARLAHVLLTERQADLSSLVSLLQGHAEWDPSVTVSVSQEYDLSAKELSSQHQAALSRLAQGTYSEPISQTSRTSGVPVWRIFRLAGHSVSLPPPFDKMAEPLREKLVQEAIVKENSTYLDRLRRRFGYDLQQILEAIPSDFEPFALSDV